MSPSHFAAVGRLEMELNSSSFLRRKKQMERLSFINVMQALKSGIQLKLKLNQISGIVASLGLNFL